MSLLLELLNENWGDDWWRDDLMRFINTIEAMEVDTDEADVELLKDMLKDHKSMRTLNGPALFKLMNIVISLRTKTGHELWAEKERLLNHFVQAALNAGDQGVADLQKHVKIEILSNLIAKDLYTALKLRASKVNRTPAELKFDDKHDVYIFIGREKFIEGENGNYRKTLEVENLYKVDRFDLADHQTLKMMKLRAQAQGGDSQVYKIELPKGTIDGKTTQGSNIPDWLVSLIDDHKQRVAG